MLVSSVKRIEDSNLEPLQMSVIYVNWKEVLVQILGYST